MMALLLLCFLAIGCAFAGTLLAWRWLKAYRNGTVWGRTRRGGKLRIIKRQDEPIVFWLSMGMRAGSIVFFYAMSLLLLVIAIFLNSM